MLNRLGPGHGGAALLLRWRCSKKPLTLTPSTWHISVTGHTVLSFSIQAYFTVTPSRSTPSLSYLHAEHVLVTLLRDKQRNQINHLSLFLSNECLSAP